MVKEYECLECGHKWKSYREDSPKRCPNRKCQTRFWNSETRRVYEGHGPNPVAVVDGKKQCSDPKHEGERIIPIENFTRCNCTRNGYRSECKTCATRRRHENADRYRAKNKELHRKYVRGHRHWQWAWHVKRHHELKGIVVDLSVNELESIAKKTVSCAYCGKTLSWVNNKTLPDTPTLDRISNGKHVNRENFAIVCHQCNRTKGERTMKEFVDYCKLISKRFGSDDT